MKSVPLGEAEKKTIVKRSLEREKEGRGLPQFLSLWVMATHRGLKGGEGAATTKKN